MNKRRVRFSISCILCIFLVLCCMPLFLSAEDCLSFNPQRLEVKYISGRWKIVEGSRWLLDFGNNKNEALQALGIIRHYGMNRRCFVGRPDPSMEYFLVGGEAPGGAYGGEDCIGFNPEGIEVKNIGGRWKIVEGSHWIMDFGGKREEAMEAYRIIREYGFDHICYVGRPDPSMRYFRCEEGRGQVVRPKTGLRVEPKVKTHEAQQKVTIKPKEKAPVGITGVQPGSLKASIEENVKGGLFSFESYKYPGRFITGPHTRALSPLYTYPIESNTDDKKTRFKIINGLSNSNYYSIESETVPRYFINTKKSGALNLCVDQIPNLAEDREHATLNIIPALSGDPFPFVSIESNKYPGHYLYDVGPDSSGMFNHVVIIGEENDVEFNKAATFILEPIVKTPPTQFQFCGKNPKDSQLGESMSAEEIQGIANSKTHWFVSNKGTIYKTKKDQFTSVVVKVNLASVKGRIARGSRYNHFGDLDFHKGNLYVATTGDQVPAIVIVFDENLRYIKYAKFPERVQNSAGWVAVNPINCFLYSSKPYEKLHVYDLNFKNGSTLTHLYDATLHFKHAHEPGGWWNNVWNQGGAFSPNGIFYYVLDHKSDEDSHYTGIHTFQIRGSRADEITIRGKNNKNENVNFMNVKYDPDWGDGWKRDWELEGVTIWDLGQMGQVHMLQLHNEWHGEDDIHLFHYKVNNTY